LYTLIVNPDNTYEVLINGENEKKGSLLEDFEPAVNPPKEIDDPNDTKPDDWVDESTIPDPDAKKPDDWDEDAPYEILDEEAAKPEGWLDDEPLTVADPDATRPEEWDDEEDGEWIAPTIPNPKCSEAPGCGEWKRPYKPNPAYKGKWSAPFIPNPEYKGIWAPRKIPNPDYFEDLTPVKSLTKIGGIGIELWTMTEDILFDNIYVGHSAEDAKKLAAETFEVKKPLEVAHDKPVPIEDDEEDVSFKADPVSFIRTRVISFIEAAKLDPLSAFKDQPETGAALVGALFTLFGMLGALVSIIGGAQKPVVTKSAKKAESADEKKKSEAASSAVDKKDDGLKKRNVK